MGGGTHSSRLDDGAAFHLLKLAVHKRVPYDKALPGTLSPVAPSRLSGLPPGALPYPRGR